MAETSGRCSYFLDRKNRHCKVVAGKGRKYCGQHEYLFESNDTDLSKKRIVCPLDPAHSCYVNKLDKHLKKCNKRKASTPIPIYHKVDDNADDKEPSNPVKISDISDEELLSLIKKLEEITSDVDVSLKVEHLESNSDAKDNFDTKHKLKHSNQVASIIGHLKNLSFLQSNICFIEFGAGRGKLLRELTTALVNATEKNENCSYLMIDKSGQRHKFDNKLRREKGPLVKRIKIDIGNLLLDKLEMDKSKKIIVIGKHLCGSATDLALKSVTNICDKTLVKGLVIALCCHHRCTWDSYVGKHFLEKFNIGSKEFSLMCAMSAWAICGKMPKFADSDKGISSVKNTDDDYKDDNPAEAQNDHKPFKNRYERLDLSHEKREKIGQMVKRLINKGRLEFLIECSNFKCELKEYISSNITLENVLLSCS
ncbi:tRNA:m(4)X modification enzyme TRM13 [Nymphon striatum]|nr:tRNA:m(4)X modification enzyme TRM13 [Nymphon striatum]